MGALTEDPRIGMVLQDRYRIVRRIASGSMSVVYRGQRLHLRRPVAIKFLRASLSGDKEFLKRFEVEARTMSQLSHPNCISVTDFGVTDAPYIVMDFVRGQTLTELVETSPIDPGRAVRIVRQVLAGLAHAHKRGIVHRDVKPANIMLTEVTCTGDHVCVFDFGLARLAEEGRIRAKAGDTVAGTPDYMSPEHVSGAELDWRADLFSTGVVLYQLLTGSKPFKAITPAEILRMHDAVPLPLCDAHMAGDFSDALEAVVTRALAKSPEERFQSAVDFADELALVPEAAGPAISTLPLESSQEGEVARRSTLSILPSNPVGSVRRWHLVAVAAVCVVLAFGAGAWLGNESRSGQAFSSEREPESDIVPDKAMSARSVSKVDLAISIEDQQVAMPVEPDEKIAEPAQMVEEPTPSGVETSVEQEPLNEIKQAKPSGMPKIISLIRAGKNDTAIQKLLDVERKDPQNAYINFLLGNLYAEQKQWAKAVVRYEKAAAGDSEYSSHRILIANVVRALGDIKAGDAARAVIVQSLGTNALPELRRVAKGKYSLRFRRAARELISQLTESSDLTQ